MEIIGERPFDKPTVYQEFIDKKDVLPEVVAEVKEESDTEPTEESKA